jgi:nucleoside phosphorylase
MPHVAVCDRGLAAGLAQSAPNAARGALATTLAVTTDDALARELGERSGCCGENLEGVAVALACAAAAVPFAALLACTNEVGARGRAQWAAGHRAAAHDTAAALITWLAAGAPGLPRG